jgi:XapX domain-containing protein
LTCRTQDAHADYSLRNVDYTVCYTVPRSGLAVSAVCDRQIGYPSTTGSRSKRNGTEFSMNAFVVSLAMGGIVGIVYGLSGVRSPAPPIIALVGLLGMVLGEQAVTLAKAHFSQHAQDQGDRPDDRHDQ